MSSAGAKFELLAERKTEVVAVEKKIAEELLEQNRKEHNQKMKILELKEKEQQLKIDLLKYENNKTIKDIV